MQDRSLPLERALQVPGASLAEDRRCEGKRGIPMVALALRDAARADGTAMPDHVVGSEKPARDIQPAIIAGTLPADAFALEVSRDDSPAIGFVMAALFSLPLWGLLIGAGVYIIAAL